MTAVGDQFGGTATLVADVAAKVSQHTRVLYLPVKMSGSSTVKLPAQYSEFAPIVEAAISAVDCTDKYVYLSARHGYATPGNPLNRPGWHCDGFGSDDLNLIWWNGPGTWFAEHPFYGISTDHTRSLEQFEQQVIPSEIIKDRPPQTLWLLGTDVVHAAPELTEGAMRSFAKVSVSANKYNLVGNTHNYDFEYEWRMWPRSTIRNDPHWAQLDFYDPRA